MMPTSCLLRLSFRDRQQAVCLLGNKFFNPDWKLYLWSLDILEMRQ